LATAYQQLTAVERGWRDMITDQAEPYAGMAQRVSSIVASRSTYGHRNLDLDGCASPTILMNGG
jgi:hypothetical protein